MADAKRNFSSLILATVVLTILSLPEMLEANVLRQLFKRDGDEEKIAVEPKEASNVLSKLIRSKRHTKRHQISPDFWQAYQHFSDIGFDEGVYEMDKVYLQYLQAKNREESARSHQALLQHLREECGTTNDPNCHTSTLQEHLLPAPKACDPYRDPYCRTEYPQCDPKMDPYCRIEAYPCDPQKDPYCAASAAEYACDPKTDPYCRMEAYPCDPQKDPFCNIEQCDPYKNPSCQSRLQSCDPQKDPYCILESHSKHSAPCDPRYDAKCHQQPFTYEEYARLVNQYCNPYDPDNPHCQVLVAYLKQVCDPYSDPNCFPRAKKGHGEHQGCDPAKDPYCRPTAAVSKSPYDCNPYYDRNCQMAYHPKDEPAPEPECDPRYDHHCSSVYGRCDPYYDSNCRQNMKSIHRGVRDHNCDPEYDRNCHRPQSMYRGQTKEGYACDPYYHPDCYPVRNSETSAGCDPYRSICNGNDETNQIPEHSLHCDPARDPYCQETAATVDCDPYTDPECYSRYLAKQEQQRENTEDCDPYSDPECYSRYQARQEQQRESTEDCDPYSDPECYSRYLARQEQQRRGTEDCDPYSDPECYSRYLARQEQQRESTEGCDPHTDPECYSRYQARQEKQSRGKEDCDPHTDPDCYSQSHDREQERTETGNCDPSADPECNSQAHGKEQERTATENCDSYTDPECYFPFHSREEEEIPTEKCDPYTDPECYYSLYRARVQGRRATENCNPNFEPHCDWHQSHVKKQDQYGTYTEDCDPNHHPNCHNSNETGRDCRSDLDPNCGDTLSHRREKADTEGCDPYDPHCDRETIDSHLPQQNCSPDYNPDCESQPHEDNQMHQENCDPYYDSSCQSEKDDVYKTDSDCNSDDDGECHMQQFTLKNEELDSQDTSHYEMICDPDLEYSCHFENDINDETTSYPTVQGNVPYSPGYIKHYQGDQVVHETEKEDDSQENPNPSEEIK